MSCFGISVALIVSENISYPIKELSKALDDIRKGKLDVDLPEVDSEDEIHNLIEVSKRYKHSIFDLLNANNVAESSNQMKTAFLTHISHELRTPMHGILSYSKLGFEGAEKGNKQSKYFYNVIIASRRFDYKKYLKCDSRRLVYPNGREILAILNSGFKKVSFLENGSLIKLVAEY